MSERFIKFVPSEEAMYLLTQKGHAFRLLTIIAESARRYEGGADGLKIGEAFIGGFENYDMTEQNYRTAKEILVRRQHLEIRETCRTRKKVTTGVTTVGTKVKLLSSSVWNINLEDGNDRSNDRPTTDQRPTNDKQEGIRRNKKEDHPSIPSVNRDEGKMTDDFSSIEKIEIQPGVFLTQTQLDDCVKIKGDIEKVKESIRFIQNSKSRKHEILDWPNALAKWKIGNAAKLKIEDNLSYGEKISAEFREYEHGNGWCCRICTDRIQDQRGIVFECDSSYVKPVFIALADGQFKQKCDNIIIINNMRKK